MRLSLQRHPFSPASEVNEISLTYEWQAHGSLWIRFDVDGLPDDIDLPVPTDAQRADGLWKTTCFELFLQESSASRYCEFNFSPSSCWAAYQFSDYRNGMRNLQLPVSPKIIVDLSDSHFAMEVTLGLPDMWREASLNASFSAVIAENSDTNSYWALSHPPDKPDFHHRDCFTHQLKAAGNL